MHCLNKRLASVFVVAALVMCHVTTVGAETDEGLTGSFLPEEYIEIIYDVAEDYYLSPYLVMAVIESESSGNPNVVSHCGAVGLMQVMPKWNEDRMKRLGCKNLYDPRQNITVGCDILLELFEEYEDIYAVLMAYNEGAYGGAIERAYRGEWSDYSIKIVERAAYLESWYLAVG